MNKKELEQKIIDFILSQQDEYEDEWYGTDRVLKGSTMVEFAEVFGITIELESLLNRCYVTRNEEGKVVAAKLVFITPEEEDED